MCRYGRGVCRKIVKNCRRLLSMVPYNANAPKMCFLRLELSSGLSVLSMSKTMPSLSNQVVLKELESGDKLENEQDSRWIIFEDEENKGWMFIEESNSGLYLRSINGDQQELTIDGISKIQSFYITTIQPTNSLTQNSPY